MKVIERTRETITTYKVWGERPNEVAPPGIHVTFLSPRGKPSKATLEWFRVREQEDGSYYLEVSLSSRWAQVAGVDHDRIMAVLEHRFGERP